MRAFHDAAFKAYNLHPLAAGSIDRWPRHFPHIADLGFNTVYINSFGASGASGSIYAVHDPFELHAAVRGASRVPAADLIASMVKAAHAQRLAVMTDLIVPHTAMDSLLYQAHPQWFRHDAEGRVRHPSLPPRAPGLPAPAMDDLAEIDLHDAATREAKLDYLTRLACHFLELGISGFRCNAAYRVPPELWRELIARVRRAFPEARFLAAALGCPFEQVAALAPCGFDAVYDSSAWWDGHAPWYLEQYEALQSVGRVIAFPEDHNSGRLRSRLGIGQGPQAKAEMERAYKAYYLRAVGIANGVMMPMGFEYGCERALDPIASTPADWTAETAYPAIDIRDHIRAVNALADAHPIIAQGGPVRRITAPNGRVVGLMRTDKPLTSTAGALAMLVMNPDPAQADGVSTTSLIAASGGRFERLLDVTPGVEPVAIDTRESLSLARMEVRLLVATRDTTAVAAPRPEPEALARLERLAADRVAIEKVSPEIDSGRFPAKRMVGDRLTVEADIFCDGHEKLAACFKIKAIDETTWRELPMAFVDNDRWAGTVTLTRNTRYLVTVHAWRDVFAYWCHEVSKKHDAGLDLSLEIEEGRKLLARTAAEATGADKAALAALLGALEARREDQGFHLARLLSAEVKELMARADLRVDLSTYERQLEIVVDRTAAAFAAWYELFPRSQSDDPKRHGTFDDVIAKLPYVKDLGFDVLYFPPIHPIGEKNRKGRNNSLKAMPDDPGSPYAIGSKEGGHKALHRELGSFEDFARLIRAAEAHGLEIAIDFAIQCSPDHPWIKEHPEWFDWRPDGTLKYAENPPKKYEDISNVSFYGAKVLSPLWLELRDVVLFWVDKGVKTFRVDNPHTKPFPFWEWMIREVQDRHPDTVFLAEAFTRPKVMSRLAKIGFTQSYSYFTWRNEKVELADYLIELTTKEPREHMRPNFFVNTPDINPKYLQTSGRAGFQVRAVLASTLSTLWGVYSGFELCEATPVPGKEDYLDSEKYEIKAWDWDRAGHIRDDIRLLNRIRRDNPALWQFANLTFHQAWNDHVLVYSKMTESLDNAILVAVNLDSLQAQECAFELPLWTFGLEDNASIEVDDLVSGQRLTWTGKIQHVWLDPAQQPYGIWRLVAPGLPH